MTLQKEKMRDEIRAQLEEEKMREELTRELRAEMGMPQKNSYSVAENEKDRIIAILLAFFLCPITAHKFYLNSPNKWILCIVSLFTCGIVGAIISIIDILNFVSCKNNEEFTKKYYHPGVSE